MLLRVFGTRHWLNKGALITILLQPMSWFVISAVPFLIPEKIFTHIKRIIISLTTIANLNISEMMQNFIKENPYLSD